MVRSITRLGASIGLFTTVFMLCAAASADSEPTQGICVVLGAPETGEPASVAKFAAESKFQVFFQSPDKAQVDTVRRVAVKQGLLGQKLFAEEGDIAAIHLGSNMADVIRVSADLVDKVSRQEILRVLRPEGVAHLGTEKIVKPKNDAVDDWSHVYHGADNNPQSLDQVARAPFRTQFLAAPMFSPMPEVTVASGGRIFKAFGHIAHRENQNAVLNTLYCISAFNGTVLWTRPLSEGFMIHRSTMIATSDTFFLADDKSCKVIDPATGEVREEIVVPDGIADGKVWKWMALRDGVLYALVGGDEVKVDTIRSNSRALGHWPWGMWKGHDYKDPRTNFGFGRTFMAIDLGSKEVRWSHRDNDYIDSRGVCMNEDRIFFYSPEKFLGALDVTNGEVVWKNADDSLLQAIGPNGRAQFYVTGYATTSYIKCNDQQLFFSGPQRERFVVASAEDGRVLWQQRQGNVQVVLRDDGVYCAGPQQNDEGSGAIYSYDGQRLKSLPIRRACTRATGSADSVFYRAAGGTIRVNTDSNAVEHIAPMRPPCQDGVIISDGLLFWGPWMCGCQLSLYGHIALGPAASEPHAVATPEPQLQRRSDDTLEVTPLPIQPNDWPAYQRDNWRSSFVRSEVPQAVRPAWQQEVVAGDLPTAPIAAGERVFVADRRGMVQAFDCDGKPLWSTSTGGPIYYPPTLEDGRLFVGSADGRVYALEAVSGRVLWTYRVAPQARWIPVYGRLISTWPVSGGVAVQDGVVYAAAGIAHYDGTYVVALDAHSGEVIWSNDTSGVVSQDVNCGISLQGELQVRGNELQFLGGGAYLVARYDRETGRCLNEPRDQASSQFATAFYPYFPEYGKYVALNHTFPDRTTLFYQPSYEGSNASPLQVLAPPGTAPAAKAPPRRADAPKTDRAPRRNQRPAVWSTDGPRYLSAFVVTPDTVIAAGPVRPDAPASQVSARSLADGKVIWQQALDDVPVKGGMAMDAQQRIFITLENGQLVCFTPET